MAKADKDGWIRHRGGKCPVGDGVLVDIKIRGGNELLGVYPDHAQWAHYNHGDDVMRYRTHKPAEQPVKPGLEIKFPENYEEILSASSGPLQWRDRLRELEAEMAYEKERYEANLLNMKQESEDLIQSLADEGLQLLQAKACGEVQTSDVLPRGLSWDKAPEWANYLLDNGCELEDSRYSWASSTVKGSKRMYCHGGQLEYVVGENPFTVISSRPST